MQQMTRIATWVSETGGKTTQPIPAWVADADIPREIVRGGETRTLRMVTTVPGKSPSLLESLEAMQARVRAQHVRRAS